MATAWDGRIAAGEADSKAMWRVFLTASVVAIVTLPLTGGDGTLQLLGAVYAGAFALSIKRPATAAVMIIAFLVMSHASIPAVTAPAGIDVRLLALPFVVLLAHRALKRVNEQHEESTTGPGTRRRRPALVVIRFAPLIIAAYGFASISWSIEPHRTLESAGALLSTWTACVSTALLVTYQAFSKIVTRITWTVLAVAALLWTVDPGTAVLNERFRGFFYNPNNLACFLVVVAPIVLDRLRSARWPVAAVLAATIAATASRAGAGALALEFAVFMLAGASRRLQLFAVILMSGAGVWLLTHTSTDSQETTSLLLLRNNDSRADTWSYGIDRFLERPFLGNGLSALEPGSIAGLGPYLLATLGLVGTASAAVLLVVLAVTASRRSVVFAALALGVLANNMFEPWIFTGGSPFFYIFWVAAAILTTTDVDASSLSRMRWRPRLSPAPRTAPCGHPVHTTGSTELPVLIGRCR